MRYTCFYNKLYMFCFFQYILRKLTLEEAQLLNTQRNVLAAFVLIFTNTKQVSTQVSL